MDLPSLRFHTGAPNRDGVAHAVTPAASADAALAARNTALREDITLMMNHAQRGSSAREEILKISDALRAILKGDAELVVHDAQFPRLNSIEVTYGDARPPSSNHATEPDDTNAMLWADLSMLMKKACDARNVAAKIDQYLPLMTSLAIGDMDAGDGGRSEPRQGVHLTAQDDGERKVAVPSSNDWIDRFLPPLALPLQDAGAGGPAVMGSMRDNVDLQQAQAGTWARGQARPSVLDTLQESNARVRLQDQLRAGQPRFSAGASAKSILLELSRQPPTAARVMDIRLAGEEYAYMASVGGRMPDMHQVFPRGWAAPEDLREQFHYGAMSACINNLLKVACPTYEERRALGVQRNDELGPIVAARCKELLRGISDLGNHRTALLQKFAELLLDIGKEWQPLNMPASKALINRLFKDEVRTELRGAAVTPLQQAVIRHISSQMDAAFPSNR